MNKNNPALRYVNDMTNAAYLTGFVRRPHEGGFYLQQNNNIDQMILIKVRSNMRVPADKTPVTVLAHVFGAQEGDSLANAVIRAYDIQRPSVRSMPALTTWVKGGGKDSDPEDFRPFSSGAGLKPSIRKDLAEGLEKTEGDSYSDDEQVVRDIIEATQGRLDTRLGDNANVVQLTGFVDSVAWIEPNEFQENGYGAIMLRQHEDSSRNIPVRLVSPAARVIMKNVSVGLPITIAGQIRMKTIPDDATGGKISNMHVRVAEVYRADPKKDIKRMPDWVGQMRDRLVSEFKARAAAKQELAKIKKAASVDAAQSAAADL